MFTAEYVLRLATAPAPGGYARSFFGVVDLLAIAPFYLGLVFAGIGLDLRAVRALRLLRLVRLLKLARYTSAIDRFAAAWRAVKEEVVVVGVAAVIVLYVCALVIHQFEHDAQRDRLVPLARPHGGFPASGAHGLKRPLRAGSRSHRQPTHASAFPDGLEAFASIFDAMWWAAVTLTTVGYGDVYPVTSVGRVFTVLMLFVALGIIAIPTGLVASALSAIRAKEAAEDRAPARPPATDRD